MLLYLITFNLVRFLIEEAPKLSRNDAQTFQAIEVWKHANFPCRNYILNGLHDLLYNMYSIVKTTKEL